MLGFEVVAAFYETQSVLFFSFRLFKLFFALIVFFSMVNPLTPKALFLLNGDVELRRRQGRVTDLEKSVGVFLGGFTATA